MRPGDAVADQRVALGRLHEGVERRTECGDVAAQRGLRLRLAIRRVHLQQLQRQPRHELELHREAHQRLEVGERVRRRLVELRVDQIDVLVHEHLLPRHEHVVEHDRRVDLVEARGERVVEDARGALRVRPARIDAQARGVHRRHERQRVVLVARHERRDVGDEEPVGQHGRRRDALGAAHDDAAVALRRHARIEKRLGLAVRGL